MVDERCDSQLSARKRSLMGFASLFGIEDGAVLINAIPSDVLGLYCSIRFARWLANEILCVYECVLNLSIG